VSFAARRGQAESEDGWQGYDGLSDLGYWHEADAMRGDSAAAEMWLPMSQLPPRADQAGR
jgi:hypothetical protein